MNFFYDYYANCIFSSVGSCEVCWEPDDRIWRAEEDLFAIYSYKKVALFFFNAYFFVRTTLKRAGPTFSRGD